MRVTELILQYLLKIKECKKNIIQPDFELVKERISKSLEELNVQSQFQNFQEVYSILKKSKTKYRFLLENSNISRVFRKNYKKAAVCYALTPAVFGVGFTEQYKERCINA